MNKIVLKPNLPSAQTEIYFDLNELVPLCHGISKRGAVLADAAIAETHGAAIQKSLGYELIVVPSGEKSKTRETKQALEDELFKRGLGRDSVFVAVGGGITTDLVGFVAATYMRGVPLVLVPTTLLAMVDAAIGGKTGVDTPFGKNLVGAFYLPKAIFITVEWLKTLPEKEMKNGLGEILKIGLIDNREIWNKCAHWKTELPFLTRAAMESKIKIIENDFQESGERRILNFGHTVGHALELISHFEIPHGEAVALGCMTESYLSYLLGYLDRDVLTEIIAMYQKLGYRLKKFDSTAFLHAMTLDKKAKGGEPRFVLINKIGSCVPFEGDYCRTVAGGPLREMVEWMHHELS